MNRQFEPAFPRTIQRWNDSLENVEGMSLRDYFAAKAMQGWFASWSGENPNDKGFQNTAELAYKAADAMLKAREA